MNKIYYGLSSRNNALELARNVCSVIGPAGGRAEKMIAETCAAETQLGTYKDRTNYDAGTGAHQIDEGTFNWLRGKYSNRSVATKIRDAFDVELSLVEYRELEFSPLLSSIFCRLRYLAVSDPIPNSIKERAKYWKKWYNTSAGKGTAEEYLQKCKDCGIDWIDE